MPTDGAKLDSKSLDVPDTRGDLEKNSALHHPNMTAAPPRNGNGHYSNGNGNGLPLPPDGMYHVTDNGENYSNGGGDKVSSYSNSYSSSSSSNNGLRKMRTQLSPSTCV